MRSTVLALALLFSLATTAASGHDLWFEPSSYRPAPGAAVELALRVGEDWAGEPVPRRAARIVRFVVVGPGGEQEVPGLEGRHPAGIAEVAEPGLHVVGYRTNNAYLELAPDAFERHLAKEGLERVIDERARRGESDRRSRELYSRCVKALLAVGGSSAGGPDRELGLTLELVVEGDPYALSPGEELSVKLLYRGAPLAGVQLEAVPRAAPAEKLVARTDAAGRVRFRLARPGPWLVKGVHMVRAQTAEADWESLWASTTFEVGGAGE